MRATRHTKTFISSAAITVPIQHPNGKQAEN